MLFKLFVSLNLELFHDYYTSKIILYNKRNKIVRSITERLLWRQQLKRVLFAHSTIDAGKRMCKITYACKKIRKKQYAGEMQIST